MVTNRKPLVSVVIPSWNRRQLLLDCLAALRAQKYEPFEVIVVDNGSDDGSLDAVTGQHGAWVNLIRNEENLGYACAVNQGIAAAGGDFIATLNNDAVPAPDWLGALVEAISSDDQFGMAASKILSFDNPRIIDGTGLLIYPDGSSRARGRLEKDVGQYDAETEALLPSGCAAIYRRRMLEEIGALEETFFAYCEDTDLGLRARLAGWRCAFAPKAVVQHHYSASSGNASELKAFLVERNRLWVAARNFPLGKLMMSPLYTMLRYALQAWGGLRGTGAAGRYAREKSRGSLLLVLLRAQWAALRGLPRALGARKNIPVRISRAEIDRWFADFGIGALELALKE